MFKRALVILTIIAVLASAGIAFLPSRVVTIIAANALLMALSFGVAGLLLCRHQKGRADV